VIWLDNVFVFQNNYHALPPSEGSPGPFKDAPATQTWTSVEQDVVAPPLQPPRSNLSLRAPPTSA
jgi:hypothetical protein